MLGESPCGPYIIFYNFYDNNIMVRLVYDNHLMLFYELLLLPDEDLIRVKIIINLYLVFRYFVGNNLYLIGTKRLL